MDKADKKRTMAIYEMGDARQRAGFRLGMLYALEMLLAGASYREVHEELGRLMEAEK